MNDHIRKPGILITGANGEIGHGLITSLAEQGAENIIALDVHPIDKTLKRLCSTVITGDILDQHLLERIQSDYQIHSIFHLAALLSTRAELTPESAHRVNVEGTLNLIKLAIEQSRWHGATVKFMFPSSIAVYGLPNREAKEKAGRVKETEWNFPITMYGCNKLYCEHLGRYYASHYRQLAAASDVNRLDFRALRFPGLISAATIPSGGTSDYAPEMLHAAAQNKSYACFVSEEARIPFMAMPDAVRALLNLEAAPRASLTQSVYNISSFSPSAGEMRALVLREFKNSDIKFKPDSKRQAIVDSWPAEVDDSQARKDWDWAPSYDLERAFSEYLIPHIRQRYSLIG